MLKNYSGQHLSGQHNTIRSDSIGRNLWIMFEDLTCLFQLKSGNHLLMYVIIIVKVNVSWPLLCRQLLHTCPFIYQIGILENTSYLELRTLIFLSLDIWNQKYCDSESVTFWALIFFIRINFITCTCIMCWFTIVRI